MYQFKIMKKPNTTPPPSRNAKIFSYVFVAVLIFGLVKCVGSCNDMVAAKPEFDQFSALTAVEMAVKQNLNDPDSYERDDWKAWLTDSTTQQYRIKIDYRAKNAFGGTVKNRVTAEVDSSYLVRLLEN
jgi:hypothetical protein